MKKRLFVAIPLAPLFQEALKTHKALYKDHRVRWVPKENLHITLHFLGYVEEGVILDIVRLLKQVAKQTAPFSLHVQEITFGPLNASKRMFWLVFEQAAAFSDLANAVTKHLEAYSSQRAHTERAVIPHVTLARFKKPRELKNVRSKKFDQDKRNMQISSFTLFASKLRRDGPIYTSLAEFHLSKTLKKH